ncbi:MAG TPA: cytochrome c-type biogenesis protein [Gemmatimonadaceae bacterium]|nr:cytochrome c-type biogenesis protein [Gemmatimonadaceae bacterium]
MLPKAIAVSACVFLLSASARGEAVVQRAAIDSVRLEQQTSAVASQLRCPVCQGLSIQDSPSELAIQMRGVVRDQLAAGRTPEQVKAYFVAKYGEWVLLEPQPTGFNSLVYILPVAAVLGGGAIIFFAVRRWSRPAPG